MKYKKVPTQTSKKKDKDTKLDRLKYKILIGFMIAKAVHYLFIEKPLIGGNSNYLLIKYWIPILIGFFVLVIYEKKHFKGIHIDKKKWLPDISALLMLGLMGIVGSTLTFGTISEIIWEQWNRVEIKNSLTETIESDVVEFINNSREVSGAKIGFKFQGKYETMSVHPSVIDKYNDKKPNEYKLILKLRKGLQDTYVIDSWKIKQYLPNNK